MKTSYYSCPLLRTGNWFPVPISNSVPRGMPSGRALPELVPNWNNIVSPFKSGEIDQAEFEKRYLRQLDWARDRILGSLSAFKKAAEGKGKEVVFLCYERTGDFCHRHILAKWIEAQTCEHVEELTEPELF